MTRRRASLAIWFVMITGVFGGCCTHVTPTQEQVEAWVHEEIPSGSAENDVKKFSERHHFAYERDTATYAQANRKLDGCDWKKPVAHVQITYDANGRITETTVKEFSVGLP